jgi:flagellar protein FlaJ
VAFITFLGRILPKGIRERYRDNLKHSTVKTNPDTFIGVAITFGIVVGFLATVLLGRFELLPPLPMFVACFLSFEILIYVWLSLNVSGKARQVEVVLPDALQLMSSNIRAGLTTDKALILAARPEFGPLEEEIRRVGKETMAGRDLIEAMSRMTNHIRSKNLERTIELVVHSLKSGGQLADLLDQTAEDLRDQEIVRKEISASVLMYVLFIFIAITIGAPMLFAMSSFLVELLTQNMAMIAKDMPKDFDGLGGAPISVSGVSVEPEFIRNYSYLSIILSCVFGSMIMGLIMKGEEKEGIKYIPVMLTIALVLFYLASFILKKTLGGMMQF